jgi:hypothetical protein
MRTNPFYDAWLFIIGATGDHEKLGAFKYVFVALFLALLAASLWIAWTNWREDPAQRTGVHLTTWFCRVLMGCQWFQGCLWPLACLAPPNQVTPSATLALTCRWRSRPQHQERTSSGGLTLVCFATQSSITRLRKVTRADMS